MFNNDNDTDGHDNGTGSGDLQAKALGILSVASGGVMLVAPHTMARLYALPRKPVALLRAIAVRDFLIGLGLLSPRWRRTAAVARGIADVGDSILIAAHAVGTEGSLASVRGRILLGLSSALTAFRSSTRHLAADPA
jgi:hypothetical protein